MRAIRLQFRGGPEALVFEGVPLPRLGEGELFVHVHAAAVTPTELEWAPTWTTRAGGPRPFPIILGHEFSGEVRAVGPRRLMHNTIHVKGVEQYPLLHFGPLGKFSLFGRPQPFPQWFAKESSSPVSHRDLSSVRRLGYF